MRKYILLILFPLTSFSEEITFQCKYKSNDDPSTEMNENIIYDPSKESLSVKRYKDPLQCVKDNWVMNCKGSYENEDDNIQDLVTLGRKDINYRQTITLTKKNNSAQRINKFKGKCQIVDNN
ncbi:hypothetical protein N9O82_00990 [Methylophilaceae bacterium]|nr:hypothetical protein [Methylophilaceae bacterium]